MSKSLVEFQVGFLFSINNAPADNESLDAEFKLHDAAHARFDELTRTLPCWSEPSTHPDDGFDINPYELCGADGELEEHNGLALFSLWVAGYREMPAEHVAQLRAAAQQAFDEAAKAVGGTARYVLAKAYREWRVTEWETLPA